MKFRSLMLSLTRSVKNEPLDTFFKKQKCSIKNAYLVQPICYGNSMHTYELSLFFNVYIKTLQIFIVEFCYNLATIFCLFFELFVQRATAQ